MLERILRHIHNRFERETLAGTFEVSSGTLQVEGARDGQYVWVEGSALNDGLHQCPTSGMADETFEGRVILLAVPQDLVALSEEIGSWCEANSEALDSPYRSESFGGYSYTKGEGSSSPDGWRGHFAADLNPYRKMHGAW